eukprot:11882230-Alexandrium_andersonii.AAC.1
MAYARQAKLLKRAQQNEEPYTRLADLWDHNTLAYGDTAQRAGCSSTNGIHPNQWLFPQTLRWAFQVP